MTRVAKYKIRIVEHFLRNVNLSIWMLYVGIFFHLKRLISLYEERNSRKNLGERLKATDPRYCKMIEILYVRIQRVKNMFTEGEIKFDTRAEGWRLGNHPGKLRFH